MFRPSEIPVLISTFFGSSFGFFPGSSTKAFFPPSSNVTRRSGIVTTSFFSRMMRSAFAEYPARRTIFWPGSSSISTSKSVAPSFCCACGAIRATFPVTTSVGRAPTLMRASRPTWSLPTSISSTVPLKMRSLMSAIVASSVPGWYDVSGTTGSPGFTARVRIVPAAGARMIESIPESNDVIFPLRVSSRSWSALATAIFASSNASRFTSTSDLGVTPCSKSSFARSYSDLARVKDAWADSSRRSTSVISRGVGSGWISRIGSPARTVWPTSTRQPFTIPEIFDLTENFCRGWICPTASAFSVIEPDSATTILMPPSSFLPELARA